MPFNNKKGYVIKNETTIKTKYVANKRLEKSNKTPSNFLVFETEKNSYSFGDKQFSRDYVKKDLATRFDHFKESEVVLASKERILATREQSLQSAMHLLEQTRSQKSTLEAKIEGLESQWRLLQASAVRSGIQVDNSKLAQTQKLIDQIKKRLDVAERVLAHESRFVQAIAIDTITEKDLLSQVDDYFEADTAGKSVD